MNKLFAKITAGILIGAALTGILLNLTGIVLSFPLRASMERLVGSSLKSAASVMSAALQAADAADKTIGHVDGSIQLLADSTRRAAASLDSASGMAGTLSGLIGEGLARTITQTKESLKKAETTAQIIDNTLAFITGMPLIGHPYPPDQGFSKSIAEINSSLDPLNDSVTRLQSDLKNSAENLGGIHSGLTGIADHLTRINQSLNEIQQSVQEYHQSLEESIQKVEYAQKHYKTWLILLNILAVIFFLLMAASQVGLLLQARMLWQNPDRMIAENTKKPSPAASDRDGIPSS